MRSHYIYIYMICSNVKRQIKFMTLITILTMPNSKYIVDILHNLTLRWKYPRFHSVSTSNIFSVMITRRYIVSIRNVTSSSWGIRSVLVIWKHTKSLYLYSIIMFWFIGSTNIMHTIYMCRIISQQRFLYDDHSPITTIPLLRPFPNYDHSILWLFSYYDHFSIVTTPWALWLRCGGVCHPRHKWHTHSEREKASILEGHQERNLTNCW